MKDTLHTRGPWVVETPMDGILSIVADADKPTYDWVMVAQISEEPDGDLNYDTIHANAALIAAAPELLAALEEIAAARPCEVMQQDSTMRVDRFNAYLAGSTVDIARAALAKLAPSKE